MATVAETKTTRRRTTQQKETESPSRAAATGRRRTAATGTTRTGTARTGAARAQAQKRTTVPVPVVTPHVSVHRVQVPTPRLGMAGHQVVDAGKAMASSLPPPGRLAYYTGLGALAVFGVVDWPVAAAIGVGVAIARRARSGQQRSRQA